MQPIGERTTAADQRLIAYQPSELRSIAHTVERAVFLHTAPRRAAGNGISVDYDVARFFADSEALYSYEGIYQMQNLIVGKAVTGFSAFL